MRVSVVGGSDYKDYKIKTVSEPINGEYNVFPAQLPRRTNGLDEKIPFTKPDVNTYLSKNHYPSKLVELGYQTDLAGQSMAVVYLFPVQYIPFEKKLVFFISSKSPLVWFEVLG